MSKTQRAHALLAAVIGLLSIGTLSLAAQFNDTPAQIINAPIAFVRSQFEYQATTGETVAPVSDGLAPQSDQDWSGGSTGNNTAWYTTTNWIGGAVPGSSSGVTTNIDIATLPSTGTNNPNNTIGINMSTPTGNIHYLGSINFTGTVNRAMGNSSATSGSLQLNGSTINGINNVILRHSGTALFTLQNNGGGAGAMNITLGNSTENIINLDNAGGLTIGSVITGAGRKLTLAGSGTGLLTLSGANTFTGPLVMSGTTLSVPTINNGSVAGPLGQSTTAAPNLVFDGGTLKYTGVSDGSTNRNFTINSGKTAVIDVPSGVNLTFSGAAAATNGGLTKTGPGALSLTGTNLYTGNTTINGGGLVLSGNGSIATSPLIEVAGGGFFDVSSLTNPFTLALGQTLKASGTTAAGTISTTSGKGLSTAANSAIQFSAYNGLNAPLTIQGSGSVVLASTNSVVVNTTSTLSTGDYILISKGSSGSVTGTVPTNLTIGGSGIAPGAVATLQITGAQLVLHVAAPASSPVIAISDLNFGNVTVGTTSSLNITVQNTGTADLVLGAVSVTGTNAAEFNVPISPSGTTITAGNSAQFQAQFTPSSRGLKSATLTLASNASSGDNVSALGGTGVAPVINVSTTSLSFGDQSVGTTSGQMSVTVSNFGDTGQNLVISPSITGTNATDFAITNSPSTTIAPGNNTTIEVKFTPTAAGSRSSALSISSNDPVNATTNISLSGTGVQPTTVDLSSATYQVVEGALQVAVTLVRGGDTSTAFMVDLNTSDSTANAGTCGDPGADYQSLSTTVSFASGDVTKVVNVPICTDRLSESPAEMFTVTLSNPTAGAALGAVNPGTVRIIDAATEFTNATFLQANAGETVSSDITVTGYQGNASGMRVTLSGLSATTADDLDVLLVDPAGHKYALVGDVGGSGNLNNVTLTFEDTGSAGFVPDAGPIAEGQNYEPTNCVSPVTDFAGSPSGAIVEPGCGPSLTNALSGTFGGENPNGAWTLYLRNDGGPALGTPVTNVSLNGWGIQFLVPTAAPVSVSGRVKTARGKGVRGAAVTISGGDLGGTISVRTGELGDYSFEGLQPGATYIVSVRAKRFVIADAVRAVAVLDNVAGVDFIARE